MKVGQIVKVKVLSADLKTKRIGLSMKALDAPPLRRAPKPGPKPKPEPTLEEKIALLASKWKTR